MADENKKGITVKIDAALHAQVKEYIESRGMTMAEFITAACDDLLHPKITEKEDKKIVNNIGPTVDIVKIIRPVYNFKASE